MIGALQKENTWMITIAIFGSPDSVVNTVGNFNESWFQISFSLGLHNIAKSISVLWCCFETCVTKKDGQRLDQPFGWIIILAIMVL